MTPETRAAAIDALTYRHDQLLESLYRERHGRFDRTDPACTSARRWLAHELLAIRRALLELRPRRWPAWYRSEPTVAWSVEGR